MYWTYSYTPIDKEAPVHGVGGVLVLCTETTARVEESQALQLLDERWHALFDQAPVFMCVLSGPEHRFEFANPRYLEMVGRSRLIGHTVAEVLPEVESQGFIALLDRVYLRGEPHVGSATPVRFGNPDVARLAYLDFVYQPIRDKDGTVNGVLVLGSDVTGRMQTQSALAESEGRYRALADHLPGGAVFVLDRDLRYVMAAGEGLARAGATHQDFVGRTVFETVQAPSAPLYEQTLRSALAGESFEVEHAVNELYFMSRGTPLRDASDRVTGVLVASFDITERRRAEHDLRTAKTQLEGLLVAAEIGSWVWDLRANLVVHDSNFARLWGWEGTEPRGGDEHFARIHPDDVGKVEAAVQLALVSGHLYIREYRIVLDDGSVRWLGGRGKVQRAADGKPATITGLVIDIGDLKALEESLLAADRRKDEFLATLAHELRNPLAPIRNAAATLKAKGGDEKLRAWGTAIIERQIQAMSRLLDDLLDVSRVTRGRLTLQHRRVSLASVVESAIEVARPALDVRRHEFAMALPPHEVWLHADPLRLSQVIANLLTNAAKYTQPGGRISLSVHVEGEDVLISVRDSGAGIAPEWLERVFDMFAQVQNSGISSDGGLGIGLALVRGLVELHGGTVQAKSAGLGHGSEFVVTLPLPSAGAGTAAPDGQIALPDGPRRRVLIADDNRDGAESLALLVATWNHEITAVVHDGRAAFEAAERSQPDIALLDIGMPEWDGYEVARRIRTTSWGSAVKLIAITGWGSSNAHQHAVDAGFDGHLTKPVDPEQLAWLISGFASTSD